MEYALIQTDGDSAWLISPITGAPIIARLFGSVEDAETYADEHEIILGSPYGDEHDF